MRLRPSRSTVVTAAVALTLIVAAQILRPAADAGGEAAPPSTRVPVRSVVLRAEAVEGSRREGGFLRADRDVTIAAEQPGRVLALPVAEGAPVDAGAPVAHLDDTSARARADAARATFRERSLDPASPAAERERAEAALREAEHALRQHHPTAAFRGIVERHRVEEGQYVVPGSPLVDLIDLSVLLLDASVDAEMVRFVAPGASIPVEVPALGAEGRREGLVRRVANRADPGTRRFSIEIEIRGAPAWRAGMYAEAEFRTRVADAALTIPKSAVRRIFEESGVFVVRGGVARYLPVALEGIPGRDDRWRVADGPLREGDTLVVAGFEGLSDGVPVATPDAPPPGGAGSGSGTDRSVPGQGAGNR